MAACLRGSILVIEDDVSLRPLFGRVLTQSGFRTATVTTTRDAQPLIKSQTFDAVVCDLSAAGGSEVFDFVSCARSQQPGLAMLLITGYAPDDIAARAKTIGLDVMEKPFSPPQLVERVTRMLARKVA